MILLALGRPGGAQAPVEPGDERLIIALPTGWRIDRLEDERGVRRLVELLPQGQSGDDWREMIVFQDFHRTPRADLERFSRLFMQDFLTRCPLSQAVRLRRDGSTPGSLRFYVHTVECAGRPPESLLVLALRGQTGLYVVQYAWRPTPPDAAALEAANVYLDRIRLCASPGGSC